VGNQIKGVRESQPDERTARDYWYFGHNVSNLSMAAQDSMVPLANVRVVDAAEVTDWLPDVLPDIHRHALAEGEVKDDRS
jgi:hypothetical protein